ncbi:LysM peptidoglycan-binding domain-containing protein, partial [Vagococcus vulneris]
MNSSREGAPFFSSNLVVFGTTIMMTSLMAVPSGIGTVYAAADTVKDKKNNIQANKSYTTLNELSIPQGLDSGTTLFDLKTTVTISGNNQSEFNLNVSPNIAMDQNLTSIDLKDNSGQIIGQADLNHDLNQIVVTLKQTGTFKTNLIIPVTLKNTDMTEQVVTLSHNDQMLSQHVVLNKEETAPSVASSSSTQETETSAEMVATDQSNKTTTSSSVKVVNSSQSVTASDTKTTTMSSTAASSTTSSTTAPSTTTSSSTTTASSSNSTTASSTSETTTSSKTQETTTASTKQEAKTTKSQVKSQQIETRMNVPQAAAAPAPMVTALGRSAQSISPQHDFVSEVAPHAQRVAGANDLYASVMIAQSILESGYGNSTLSQYPNHNLFGIKGKYQGQSVKMLTWEHINGQDIQIYDDFRKYPSFSESFEDNARVIKTTSFYPGNYFYAGAWKSNTKSYRDATAALTGKYATDPNYNNKLNSLIEKFNLTQYDGGGDASGTINVSTGSNTNSNESSNTTNNGSQQIHTVQRGDTLFAISRQYDVSIGDLMSWNGLSNHTIYVGQKLTIRGSSGGGKPPVTNEVKPDATIEPNTSTNGNNSGQNQTNGTYTVKSGDTLYGISRQTGMSVAAIKSANSLSSDTIY